VSPPIVVLAAGMARRFGSLKQLEPVGPNGECLLDFGIADAVAAGFTPIILVIRRETEADFVAHLEHHPPGAAVRFAFQEPDDLPPGRSRPQSRTKPWGTAHAVLSATQWIGGPFAVMNADDFYGRQSFEKLSSATSRLQADSARGILATFELATTLSEHGGVSRAVCEIGDGGRLERIVEHTEIHATRRGEVRGFVDDREVALDAATPVSMNLWSFTVPVLGIMRDAFSRFLEDHSGDDAAECLLPDVIGAAIDAGRIHVDTVQGANTWFGMTFPDDRDAVSTRLRALVDGGEYTHLPRSH
jgi:MobA-like NTP transferase domain